MSVKLTISVSDIDTTIASFDVIRIRRSVTVEAGPYSLLTSDAPRVATLSATGVGPYTVAGETLELSIDNQASIIVTFTGTARLTTSTVVSQINAQMGDVVSEDDSNTLKLMSTVTGTGSAVDVIDGTSLAAFGFTAGDRDVGEDAHITLITDQNLYDYVDRNGDGDYFYTAQFYNTVNFLASEESDPFKGDPGTVVGASNLSLATVDLADGSGVAVAGQEISLYSVHEPLAVDGFQIALMRAPITITTDNAGHAEVKLVRGLKMKVVFEGTSLIREITVPDADDFDLISLVAAAPDPYGIVIPQFPYAIRRTL